MNFQPELVAKVVSGEKTVTRRIANDNPRSPWWRGGCSLIVGHDYAVCPGRGKPAVTRVRIVEIRLVRLGWLDDNEATREGFDSPAAFREAWEAINGGYDPGVQVWRVEFEAPR